MPRRFFIALREAFALVSAVILSVTLTSACASGGTQPERNGNGRPPVMESTMRPQLRYPDRPQAGRLIDMTVEVQVDADGVPDLKTLRVTGLGSIENQDVIEEWVRQAKFKPAVRDGVNVPGLYRNKFNVVARVQRM